MPESSRSWTAESLQTQARILGLDMSAVDAGALLDRVKSGLDDVDKADELCPGHHEPAVIFNASQGRQ
jgi:hypothetical protein